MNLHISGGVTGGLGAMSSYPRSIFKFVKTQANATGGLRDLEQNIIFFNLYDCSSSRLRRGYYVLLK